MKTTSLGTSCASASGTSHECKHQVGLGVCGKTTYHPSGLCSSCRRSEGCGLSDSFELTEALRGQKKTYTGHKVCHHRLTDWTTNRPLERRPCVECHQDSRRITFRGVNMAAPTLRECVSVVALPQLFRPANIMKWKKHAEEETRRETLKQHAINQKKRRDQERSWHHTIPEDVLRLILELAFFDLSSLQCMLLFRSRAIKRRLHCAGWPAVLRVRHAIITQTEQAMRRVHANDDAGETVVVQIDNQEYKALLQRVCVNQFRTGAWNDPPRGRTETREVTGYLENGIGNLTGRTLVRQIKDLRLPTSSAASSANSLWNFHNDHTKCVPDKMLSCSVREVWRTYKKDIACNGRPSWRAPAVFGALRNFLAREVGGGARIYWHRGGLGDEEAERNGGGCWVSRAKGEEPVQLSARSDFIMPWDALNPLREEFPTLDSMLLTFYGSVLEGVEGFAKDLATMIEDFAGLRYSDLLCHIEFDDAEENN